MKWFFDPWKIPAYIAAVAVVGFIAVMAQAQPITNPAPVGGAGAYNSVAPTCTAGQFCFLQTDVNGNLKTTAGGTTTVVGTQSNASDAVATSSDNLKAVSWLYAWDGTTWDRVITIQTAPTSGLGVLAVANAPTTTSGGAIATTQTAAAANNLVIKAASGNLYSVYATNQTATAGFLMVFNATAAPVDGAVTPIDCVPLPASGVASLNFGIPARFGTGITAVVSSGANCFTKTTGVITAFIKGMGV